MTGSTVEISCGVCDGRMKVANPGNVTCPHCGVELSILPDAFARPAVPTVTVQPTTRNYSQRVISFCLVFIVVVICWEAFAGWKWESEMPERLESATKTEDWSWRLDMELAVKTGDPVRPSKSAAEIEREVREENNPYSFFR